MFERVDAAGERFRVLVHDEVDARLGCDLVAERVHVAKLPRRIDVEQRKGQRAREESLLREVEHHRRILADRIEHHRLVRLGDRLAQDMDALGLEPVEMGQLLHVKASTMRTKRKRKRAAPCSTARLS